MCIVGGLAWSDEVSEVLEIEDMAAVVSNAAATAGAPSAPELTEADIDPAEISALIEALEQKNEELVESRREIAKLKDVIRRIWEANRREQRNMHYNMGCVYKACRHFAKAEEEFLKALEFDEMDPHVHYNLAILYDDDIKDVQKARRHYERFLELAPKDKDAAKVHEWLSCLQ